MESTAHGEDQEPRIIHSWSEKDYWKLQARAILAAMLGGLFLIWIGVARCASSHDPITFGSGVLPIVGGMVLLVLGCIGIRRRHREKTRLQ